MKHPKVAFLVSIAMSLLTAPLAYASGFILVDQALGAPVNTVAVLTPPVAPPVIRTPGRAAVAQPVIRHPQYQRTILKGSVSLGLHLKGEAIKVDINDQIARTYICQTFVNDTDRNLAGTYLFPLPDDTTFSSFSLHIDGRPVEGKILEANEARQQYEEIVRRMVDPGLLEYADYKTVRVRIFPIPAHGEKKVELEYTQVLKAENGMLKYRFPLKTESQSIPIDEVKVDLKLASAQGLRTIWSPSHTVSATRKDDHHAIVSLAEQNTLPDKDFLLYYSVSDKELTANLITNTHEGNWGYFLLTLSPPVSGKQILAKDIVLVADTSGSMQGEKMEQAKKALKYVVNALNAGDRFNIIGFNTDVEGFCPQLVSATQENKKSALSFINELEAHGGTNIGDALRSATTMLSQGSHRPSYLVFMTDGEPTVGETDVSRLLKIAANNRNIRIFDFGVGYDVNTRLLNRLAEENHGAAEYVEPNENLETALSSFYHKIKSPVLSNVSIAYEGIQVKDVYPREVKDIFAGTQVLLIGKYKGSGKATVQLAGQLNGTQKAFSFPLSFARQETSHTYLPRLWAMRRIGYLSDIASENGGTREVTDEIIALSKTYGIISAYTSFLVTDPSENHRLAASNTASAMPSPSPMAMPLARRGTLAGAASPTRSYLAGTVGQQAEAYLQGGASQDSSLRAKSSWSGVLPAVGKSAVDRSKIVNDYKWGTLVAQKEEDKDQAVKTIEDKTFYLINGFWTDSTYKLSVSPPPETISFGSPRYFELVRTLPGMSKYLAAGTQIILVYKGHVYKIVNTSNTKS